MTPQVVKKHIQRCFSKAAHSYDAVASLQQHSGQVLLTHYQPTRDMHTILDVGCGTGFTTRQLFEQVTCQQRIAMDLSDSMLHHAAKVLAAYQPHLLQADFERIPLANASVDWIFSNMSLQWSQDLQQVLRELRRLLRPGGALSVSFCLGVETPTFAAEFNQFYRAGEVEEQAKMQGFIVKTSSLETVTLAFKDRLALMQYFKKTGTNYALQPPVRKLGKHAQATWTEPVGEAFFTVLYLLLLPAEVL